MSFTNARIAAVTGFLVSSLAWASPLSPLARTLIPSDVRQIICVDYRTAKTFETAMTLKAQVLPDNLKAFERALNGVGVNADKEIEALTFISFDDPKQKPTSLAVVSGSFSPMTILTE